MSVISNITYRDRNKEKNKEMDQQTLRLPKQQSDKKFISFVTTNNPRDPEVYIMIRSNLPILQNDAKMKNILDYKEIIKSNRQPRNLKHI